MTTIAATPIPQVSSVRRPVRALIIITHDARHTGTADRVCAGKDTMASDHRRKTRMLCPLLLKVHFRGRATKTATSISIGTMRILSINADCRPASCWVNNTVWRLSAHSGLELEEPQRNQRDRAVGVAPMKSLVTIDATGEEARTGQRVGTTDGSDPRCTTNMTARELTTSRINCWRRKLPSCGGPYFCTMVIMSPQPVEE